jgi:hypothetical protein
MFSAYVIDWSTSTENEEVISISLFVCGVHNSLGLPNYISEGAHCKYF